ncbi:ORF38 [Lymantria xylina nucleopolyhedrovirus]|uniref:ORF38 n=1 Tax=Lymantria xylina multiple nucleopolyhedrovirus TaxID=2847840 RepID=D4N275_9ABAC|nr:ORF38 [Lymantria xylina nucleopolyhedrovirus]ADD73747.1 ORF38 [Lymantria xylina nucleopolyhedrovirus]
MVSRGNGDGAAESQFRRDLAAKTAGLVETLPPADVRPQLGDVLQMMGEKKLLLVQEKDDNFDINERHLLSDEARDYLNALQTDKLFACRACYHGRVESRCAFHAAYLVDENAGDEYIRFLNSDMGIINRVELYYSHLSAASEEAVWRAQAADVFRKLTGFEGVRALLTHYERAVAADADAAHFECMAYE